MDRLAGITAFVRVAESGGFTAAAPRLNLSTATVSEQVQALENALGVRLLNRTTRQVSLTEIGREYYERCVQILQELDEALDQHVDEGADLGGHVPTMRIERDNLELGRLVVGQQRHQPPRGKQIENHERGQ